LRFLSFLVFLLFDCELLLSPFAPFAGVFFFFGGLGPFGKVAVLAEEAEEKDVFEDDGFGASAEPPEDEAFAFPRAPPFVALLLVFLEIPDVDCLENAESR
jgi:hypothetical protein